MPRGNFCQQPPDFAFGHFGIGFVFKRGNGLPVFLAAHDAAKFKPRAGHAKTRRWRNFFRNRFAS